MRRDKDPAANSPEAAALRALSPKDRIPALRGQTFRHPLQIQRDGAIDETARTVWIALASEAPYERWWGREILDVKKGAIREDRLKSGIPLLVGHDTGDQVGIFDQYEITADRRLRGLARFGRSARAEEIFRDVIDNIRRDASLGYVIHDLILEREEEGYGTYRITDWEPLEGSLVSVPADPSVGVGRAAATSTPTPQQRRPDMEAAERAKIEADTRAKVEAEFAARAEAERAAREKAEKDKENTPEAVRAREQKRVQDIMAAGDAYKDFGGPEIARELIKDENATVETLKARVADKVAEKKQKGTTTAAPAYGSQPRVRYMYGQLRCFRDLPVEGGGTLKAEEAAYRAGMWLAAAVHQKSWAQRWCRDNGVALLYRDGDGAVHDLAGYDIRAQNENALSAGGALVPIEMENAIIMLRDSYGVMRRLARSRPMNVDQLKVPRRKSGLTAYFFQDDDGTGITESQKAWDNVTLSTRKLGCLAKVSRDLVEDAVISVIDDLGQEMAYAFAKKEDECYINGDGTSTYGGIQGIVYKMNQSAYISRFGMAHNTFVTIDNTDITNVQGALAQYADTPDAIFLTSHVGKHTMFNRLKAVAGGNRLDILGQRPDDQYLGYTILTSEAMPKATGAQSATTIFLFGRFDLASSVGNRRGIEMQTLVERYAELGQIGVIATERFDINIHDLGTTSSSDVNGGKGPVAAGYGS